MSDAMTATGVLLVLGTLAWYAGSALLRAAAFGWFVFAVVGLLLAGHGDQSPWAPVAFAGLGGACWAAGRALRRARRGRWATPSGARVFSRRRPRCRRWRPAPRAGQLTGRPGRADRAAHATRR